MDSFWHTEIVFNLIIQNWGLWLTPAMRLFSLFGQQELYVLVLPTIYWCFDAGIAIKLTFLLVGSGYSNSMLKITFHGARPYWFDPRVKAIATESSFGMPSGHAQNAASIWGFFSIITIKKWLKVLLITLILLIGISRLYLGVHFASDIILGWFFGGFILFLFVKLEKPFLTWFERYSFLGKTIFISIISFLMLTLGTGWLAIQSQIAIPENWNALVKTIPGSVPINPYYANDIVTFSGVFWGMMVGHLWLARSMNYNPAIGTPRQKLGRLFLGFIGIIPIVYGIAAILPSGSDLLGQTIRLFKYALVSLWAAGLAPVLFKKCSFM
jgi:membrane-associated phospholipid phosphatase